MCLNNKSFVLFSVITYCIIYCQYAFLDLFHKTQKQVSIFTYLVF